MTTTIHTIPDDFTSLDVAWVSKNFLDLFAATVEKYADTVAVTSRGRQITYRELDMHSNTVAHAIFNMLGDGKSPVALLFSHDLGAIVAVLGVLKTGRPYVAMDSSFPFERMNQIMDDSQAAMILYDDEHHSAALQLLNVRSSIQLINTNELDYSKAIAPRKVEISAKDACIIYYTSGSTGKPKGVVWGHQQLVSNVIHNANAMYFSPSDVFMFVTSIAFASSRTIFDVLASGARIGMFDIKTEGIGTLRDWMISEKVTLFRGGVQVFRTLFSGLEEGFIFPSLRAVGLGGQSSTSGDVALCRAHTLPGCSFLHSLVNTEIGVLTALHITSDMPVMGEQVPLGTPLPDKEIILVDEDGNIVSNGYEGEIVVRADFYAPGYLNDDVLNAQKYKQNPDGTTTFFSGDIGYWNEDGFLEHRGRKDDLVKIRGYRVKLSEVETVLRKNPLVRDVAVLAIASKAGNNSRQLAAYVVPVAGANPSTGEIRTQLAKQLPGYMVPTFVIFLDALPQTINGKVDKKSLPDIPERDELLETELPANKLEEDIISIWRRILRVTNIGVNDNFFDLGGDSLLAMQLLLEIEKEFSRKMPLAIVSMASTVRQQAEILNDKKALNAPSILIPIKTDGNKEPIYCLAGAGGNAFRFHPLLKYLPEDRPVYFIRSRGLEAGEWIETTLDGIASGYLMEIKRIQPKGPYHFIGSSGGGLAAYEMAQQLQRQGEKVGLFVMLDTFVPKKREDVIRESVDGNGRLQHFLKKKKTATKGLGKRWKKRLRRQEQRIKQNGLRNYFQLLAQFLKFRMDVLIRNFRKDNIFKLQRKVEKANYAAGRTYQIKPYLGRVIYFRADRKAIRQGKAPDIRWENIGVEELVIYPMNCGHFELLLEPFVQQVAQTVRQYLD